MLEKSRLYGLEASEDSLLQEALTVLTATLDEADIDLGEVTYADVQSGTFLAESRTAANDDHAELHAVVEAAKASAPRGANPCGQPPVVIALSKCLRYTQNNGSTNQLEGFCPRIPGGVPFENLADGVFLKDGNCDIDTLDYWSDGAALGRVLSHEFGHYLGLYHSEEASGVGDHLADTEADKLMNYLASGGVPPPLSPLQREVLRYHPRICYQS